MNKEYKTDCYDSNPSFQIYYSHGMSELDPVLKYLHYDENLMIEYFRKGESTIYIEGNIYKISEGDIVIVTPDELHVSSPEENCYIELISLHIHESLLSLFGGNRTVFFDTIVNKKKGVGNLITSDVVRQLELDVKLNQCLKYAQDSSLEAQVLFSCTIIELLAQLSKLYEKENVPISISTSSNKTVNEMIKYIDKHCTEDITLDILADRFHFSKSYISHLFKDYVGISPYDYLIIHRMRAFNNLVRKNHSIQEAFLLSGFNNYSNFFRLYKKHFKITPQQFKNSLNESDNHNH